MKFVRDYIEFRKLTKPVRDDFDLDISPDMELGIFFPHRLDELKQFCLSHPRYHIMSLLPPALKLNKPVASARFYLLAEGDADPDLWYRDPMNQDQFEDSEIRKFERS